VSVAPEPMATPVRPHGSTRFARNSLGSMLRTSSGAFLALLLPPILIRELGRDGYGVWAIGVEIGIYLALFEFGAFSAIGHFTASVRPLGDREGDGRVVSTMLALQTAVVAIGALLLLILVAALSAVYSGMPAPLVPSGRWAVALLGGSALVSLVGTTLSGYFLAIQRVVLPAMIIFGARGLGAVLVVVLALTEHGIPVLASAWAAATVAGQLMVITAYGRLKVPVRPSLVSWPLARQMLGFCGAYALWVIAGLLVVGLDTLIVARLDFSQVAPYAAAATGVSMLTAAYGSALGPMLPLAARLATEDRREELGALLLRVLRLGGTTVAAASALLALAAGPLLRVWVGGSTATHAVPLLQVLLAANGVRLLILPYPTLLFGTAEHRRILSTPFVEGAVNVAVSIALGILVGPIGVAVGTLVGAVLGVGLHVWFNLPRTASLDVTPATVLRRGLGGPLTAALPAVLALAVGPFLRGAVRAIVFISAAIAVVVLAWSLALEADDREAVRATLRRRASPRLRP
jgi:O-antigen/teichoic acid export membrane protein